MKVRDLTEISSFKNNVLIHYSNEMMCATNPNTEQTHVSREGVLMVLLITCILVCTCRILTLIKLQFALVSQTDLRSLKVGL